MRMVISFPQQEICYLYSRLYVLICHCYLSVGAQIMQEQPAEQLPVPVSVPQLEDARDCLQCLIIMYGETHIDTLAQLLNLTAYAETEYSHLRVMRRR